MNRIMMTGVAAVFALVAEAGEVTATSVTAQQRYPWNGLVDITVTIQGSAEDVVDAECSFVATNALAMSVIRVEHITRTGADAGSGNVWTRKFIWDARADVGAVKIDDVVLAVKFLGGVQLWENGPYWAECNVGATKPEEYGYYFWWGDTVGYKRVDDRWDAADGSRMDFSFSEGNCPTYGKNDSQLLSEGYIDSTGNLVAAHDGATVHLGAPWRMPTYAEFSALQVNCTTTWTSRNGVSGRLVTGRGAYASKSIFFPAGGDGYGSGIYSTGNQGHYWLPSMDSGNSSNAYILYFYRDRFQVESFGRYSGRPVRPVRGCSYATWNMAGAVSTHLSLDCRGSADAVTATSVTAQQRHPWNGLVDITVTIQGSAEDVAVAECSFAATNNSTKSVIRVEHITRNGVDEGSGNVWTRKFIWDVKKDVGAVKIDDVTLIVDADLLPYVRLWENGPYWAKCNVGAAQPEESGYYFWWGDTVGYKREGDRWDAVDGSRMDFSFSEGNCPTCGKNDSQLLSEGYIDSTGNLVAAYDAATAHLGAPWRMPTDAEFSELISNCTITRMTRNGVSGYLMTGKGAYALTSVFLPSAGSACGDYWSSTPVLDMSSFTCVFSGSYGRGTGLRYYGYPVRPIREISKVGVVSGEARAHLSVNGGGVTSVVARQRFPWNGLVDIVVMLQVEEDELSIAECVFGATNSATKAEIPLAHIRRNGNDLVSGTFRMRKFVWDAFADIGAVKIDDVVLTVGMKSMGVQLWENGPYWSECNVGAAEPEDYGYYFWWGDTVGYKRNGEQWDAVDGSKTGYSFSGRHFENYIDSTRTLTVAHDAATAHCGAPWRMPTDAEFSALIDNCTITWAKRNGVSGLLVTGKGSYASKGIFLPAAGYGHDSYFGDTFFPPSGCYWSSTLYSDYSNIAKSLHFCADLGICERRDSDRAWGSSVRPVRGFAGYVCDASSGVTTHLAVDCRGAKVVDSTHPLVYDATWYEDGVTVKISAEGQEIVSGSAGEFAWASASDALHLLNLNVYNALGDVVGIDRVFCLGREDLTELVIPKGTTEIDDYAFVGGSFTSVSIPNSVTNVALTAFADCSNIVEVSLCSALFAETKYEVHVCDEPEGDWSDIGNGTYRSNVIADNGSTEMHVLLNLKEAQKCVFKWKVSSESRYDKLEYLVDDTRMMDISGSRDWETKEVLLEAGEHTIVWRYYKDGSQSAGEDCGWVDLSDLRAMNVIRIEQTTLETLFPDSYASIRSVRLDDDFTAIGRGMFAGCAALKTVELPEGVTNIASGAFRDCVALETILLPESLEAIGDEAFAGCTALKAIVLPKDVAVLGKRVFSGCAALSDVTLSRALTAIPDGTFAGCDALDSFVVPEAVMELGSQIVPSATTAIYYLGNAPMYAADVYAQANAALVSYVVEGTKGWDGRPTSRDIPRNWPTTNARAIMPWSPVKIDVTFVGNGGTLESPAGESCVCKQIVGTAYSLPQYEPVRKGYRFDGYWTDADGGAHITSGVAVKLTKDHSLYAHWKECDTPTVEGDEGETVTGNAETGFVVKPSAEKTAVEVTIPQGVDAAKVTVEVSVKVMTVKPNGAKVKVVVGENDITDYLVIPESGGVLNIAAATVKEEIVKETLDPSKDAVIELNAANPRLITAPTRKGLTYTLFEGRALESLSKGDSKLGDGNSWKPTITVSGGDTGFYSIDVSK